MTKARDVLRKFQARREVLPVPPLSLDFEIGEQGGTCPCCGQYVRVYRRKIYAAPAKALIAVARAGGLMDYVHVPTTLQGVSARGGDFCKLSYWGLIEPLGQTRKDGSRRSGYWRITPEGEAYLRGNPVPKYAYVYNDEVLRWSPEKSTIHEALGQHFDYSEL